MKNQWKGFIAGILVALFLVGSIGTAYATVGSKTVEVDYNNISVTLNGNPVNLVDANGNAVEPFAIAGTTYLPVRAVSSALGLDVGWDGSTSTVILTQPGTAQKPTPELTPSPAPEPTQAPGSGSVPSGATTGAYVGSIDSDKYHYPSCRWAQKIHQENEIWFSTKEDAKAAGYSPCGVCKPGW